MSDDHIRRQALSLDPTIADPRFAPRRLSAGPAATDPDQAEKDRLIYRHEILAGYDRDGDPIYVNVTTMNGGW